MFMDAFNGENAFPNFYNDHKIECLLLISFLNSDFILATVFSARNSKVNCFIIIT